MIRNRFYLTIHRTIQSIFTLKWSHWSLLTICLLQEGLQFLLSPAGCAEPDWLLLLVSSAPGEADLRAGWRQELSLLETEAGRGVKVRPGPLSSDD